MNNIMGNNQADLSGGAIYIYSSSVVIAGTVSRNL